MKSSHVHTLLLLIIVFFYSCQHPATRREQPFQTSPEYQKGESYVQNLQIDSAFYYFNRAATQSTDRLQIAMAYNKMAILQSDAGDYFGSQETLLSSLEYLNPKDSNDRYCLTSNYNELGLTNLYLKNYDRAIHYFEQALPLITDQNYRIITLNNKALAYQKKSAYRHALTIFESIVDSSKNDPITYARVLSNLARTKWLQDPSYKAGPEMLRAMHIRWEHKDSWGLNASYGHLADYYKPLQTDSAKYYANALYHIAVYLNSPEDELDGLAKLIGLNAPDLSQQYFTRHQQLSDSLQTARNNAKNQFALIRYNTEKYKADKLVLQKENAEKKLQIIWQWGALALILILGGISLLWYRKRKQQAIQEHQLKTSQKVHDVVANGLYRIMKEIEYDPNLEKEKLLDDMEALYEQSRNLSYEPAQVGSHPVKDQLPELLKSFSTSTTSVSIVGYSPAIWQRFHPNQQYEIRHVLQELMVNMRKHSGAKNVVVKFEQQEREIKIQYTDDGGGLPQGHRYGNGLTSTENRIKTAGGRIIFDPSTTQGLKILISIPILEQ